MRYKLVSLLSLCMLPAMAAAADFNIGETQKSVVLIRTMIPGAGQADGSGFIVSSDGLIYTNRHVIMPEGEIKGSVTLVGVPSVKDPDTLEYFRAEVVYAAPKNSELDFAVLKIAGKDDRKFAALKLGDAAGKLGDSVAVLGFPYVKKDQPSLSFNKGTISTAKRKFDDISYCQTDAAINPGNSGGPLLNTAGDVIGIVTAKKLDAESIGFALHLSEIKESAAKAGDLAAGIKAQAGPVDLKDLPRPNVIAANSKAWDTNGGTITQGKEHLEIDNNGGEYALVSKTALPENFEMTFTCQIAFLKGRQVLQPSQRSILRCLAIRICSDDVKTGILSPKGYFIKFTAELALMQREGGETVAAQTGNSDEPMLITITKNSGVVTFAVNRKMILTLKDPKPLNAKTKVMIGGYLSSLAIGEVAVTDLGASTTTAPATTSAPATRAVTTAPASGRR